MKFYLKVSESDFEEIRKTVLSDLPKENAVFALAGISVRGNISDIIIRRPVNIPKGLFNHQSENRLGLASKAINGFIALCEVNGMGAVICHSHPGDIPYSPSDDHGEFRIFEVLRKFIPGYAPTVSLLFHPTGVQGRVWISGSRKPIPLAGITIIGDTIKRICLATAEKKSIDSVLFDRQILAFGRAGQEVISAAKVGIIGVGGTGSPIAEQLVRLGVRDIVLIDHDRIEPSNLTRMYGTYAADISGRKWKKLGLAKHKVNVIADHLIKINPNITIRAVKGDVVRQKVAETILDRDIIFLCTDNHWSRAVLNEICYQYFIPTINTGVRIDAKDGRILGATGVVDILRPDLPCLWCRDFLRADRIAVESLPEKERRGLIREGYVETIGLAPSVISLTTTVSGLATTAFLHLLTGFMGKAGNMQRQYYDILTGLVSRGITKPPDKCICKKVRAFGDLKKLSTL